MIEQRAMGHPGAAEARIRLLDADADLVRYLNADDRAEVARISLPVETVPKGSLALAELLEHRNGFAAMILQGIVLHHLAVGSQPGLRVLGSGEVVGFRDGPGPTLVGSSRYRASSETRLAVLGPDFLAAARRAPLLFVGLQAGMAEQTERLAAQLVICQLPRVADRVLAMLWLLADSFGKVTPAGTTLPMALTHEALGALVGARRPTVTLALGELAERGAVVHQDRGWLLLERPEQGAADERALQEEPRLLDQAPSEWAIDRGRSGKSEQSLAMLAESVSVLREQHRLTVDEVRDQLKRLAVSRRQNSEARRRLQSSSGVSRQLPPSS